MRNHRFLSVLALIAVVIIPLLHPYRSVLACPPAPPPAAFIDNTTPCNFDLDGVNNVNNTHINESTLNGDMNAADSTNTTMTNTILNTSTGLVSKSSDETYLYGGNNLSTSADLTAFVTNDGIVTTSLLDGAGLYGAYNNSIDDGNVTSIVTNNGTVSNTVNGDAYIRFLENASPNGDVTETGINNGLISVDFITAVGSRSAYMSSSYNNSTGNEVDTLTNNGTISSGDGGKSYIQGAYNKSDGTQTNILTNNLFITSGDNGKSTIYVPGNESNVGVQTDTLLNTGTISSGDGSNSYSELQVDYANGSGTENANITNTGTLISGDQGSAGIKGSYHDSSTATGLVNNTLINTGLISSGYDGYSYIIAFDNSGIDSNQTTVMINTGVMTGGDHGRAYMYGPGNGTDFGSVTNTLIQNGMISAGPQGEAFVNGGDNESYDGDQTNNVYVGGTITSIGMDTEIPVTGGGNYSTIGNQVNNIYISGSILTSHDVSGVPVSVYGGDGTYSSGTTTNTTHLTGWNPTIVGFISGDGYAPGSPDNGALDTLIFQMQTTNEGLYKQWQAEIAAFGGTIPSSGSITWGDKTYYWQNMDELENLVKFLLIVTWFNPNDGRYNGQPADRIVIYCHADKDNLGVLLVNNDSKGNVGTSFTISKLELLGKGGTSVNFGSNGILSIMMDNQGGGYAAWNGGVDGANGQGDFAKTFSCPLPS